MINVAMALCPHKRKREDSLPREVGSAASEAMEWWIVESGGTMEDFLASSNLAMTLC